VEPNPVKNAHINDRIKNSRLTESSFKDKEDLSEISVSDDLKIFCLARRLLLA
jgi:hypothetical protein